MSAVTQTQREVDTLPLEAFNVADPRLYQEDLWRPYFARLRREAPVHYCPESAYGPYWSVTKYKDIMTVEVNHEIYSSAGELGGIQVEDQPKDMDRPSFIRMDPPKHTQQRRVVAPIVATEQPEQPGGHHPRAHRPRARRAAARRDVRLGRPRLRSSSPR